MKVRSGPVRGVILFLSTVLVPAASAFDANQTFARGTYVVSGEGSYGERFDLEGFSFQNDIKFWNAGGWESHAAVVGMSYYFR